MRDGEKHGEKDSETELRNVSLLRLSFLCLCSGKAMDSRFLSHLRFRVYKFNTTPTAKVQTAHHMCTEDDEMDCKLFMDFDMAVLGRPWPQYEMYSGLPAGEKRSKSTSSFDSLL